MKAIMFLKFSACIVCVKHDFTNNFLQGNCPLFLLDKECVHVIHLLFNDNCTFSSTSHL